MSLLQRILWKSDKRFSRWY